MQPSVTNPAEARIMGAIGRIPAGLRSRLIEAQPDWASHDLDTEHAVLISQGRTLSWRGPREHGVLWSAQGEISGVSDWADATHAAVASGIAVSGDKVTLHASAWGFQPVYVTQPGSDYLVFSTSTSALVDLIEGPLDPDWDAWASILSLLYPVDGRTPFAQISKLMGAERREFDVRTGHMTSHRDLPRALGIDRPPADPGEVIEAIRGALANHPALNQPGRQEADYLASLPLSGGWDSRMLGSIAVDVYGADAFLALTSAKNREASDPDVTFGSTVAQHFGVTHEVILPDGRTLPTYAQQAFEALEYETGEHAWLQPAANKLHARGLPVVDGLAGDTLIKNRSSYLPALAADSASVVDLVWQAINRHPHTEMPAATPAVMSEIGERARAGIAASRAGLEGMPNDARLTVLRTRSVGVSLSPFKMIASGAEVITPMLHPAITSALLSIPWNEKSDSAFARRLLEASQPGLSKLPSTNDGLPGVKTGRRRTNRPEVRAWTAERLSRLDEFISYGFTPADIDPLHSSWGDSWRQRLILLTCWLDKYEARLTSTCPPWWRA